jgi:3-oxoacyl-[acyl-carrier-protein] synthase III
MAKLKYHNIGISGLAAAVPSHKIDNLAPNEWFTEKEAKSVVKMTGIRERRVAPPELCASDFCFAAADNLLREMQLDRTTIDVLIFISQTPDYRMPATGIILQNRLGLPKSTAAFDINLGCSGYVYGLSLAYSFCLQPAIRRVLLLNGETRTKVYSSKDKSTGLLFGDGGAATLVERKASVGDSYFSLNADGKRSHYIMIKSGGYRNMSSIDSLTEKQYEDGSIRNDEQGIMDGAGVFDFTIQDIPRDIEAVLGFSGNSHVEIDYFLLHQANKFITDHIARKMNIPMDKVPYSLQKFGNTSSVSIPLTMVSELREQLMQNELKLLMTGFGVGLSWGTCIINTDHVHVCDLFEI